MNELVSLVIKRGKACLESVKSFMSNNWPTFQRIYKHLLYGTRAALLLYVAWFAFTHAFFAWGIAFVYFATVDYWNQLYIK